MIKETRLLVYDTKNKDRPVEKRINIFEMVTDALLRFKNTHRSNLIGHGGDKPLSYYYSNNGQDARINIYAIERDSGPGANTGALIRVTSSTITAIKFKPTLLKIIGDSEFKDLKVDVSI